MAYGASEWSRRPSPAPRSRATAPGRPGRAAPPLVQALSYARDPLGFLPEHQRRYGDLFTVRFPYFGRVVYVARPDLVKAVFTGAPSVFHAGEANATVLEPALGPNSVLTLDDAPHMRQRKLLLPPFHGERVRALRRADRRDHPRRRWRAGRSASRSRCARTRSGSPWR